MALSLRVGHRFLAASHLVTLGAQTVVIGDGDRILLIRHGYRPGWHFPGGGVERGETLQNAAVRELVEETGVETDQPPDLFGFYANFDAFPGDHIALFRVIAWRQPIVPPPNREIAEQAFFHWTSVPTDTNPGARRRLLELFGGAPPTRRW